MEASVKTIAQFLEIYGNGVLWQSLRAICDRPHHELRVEHPFVDVGEAKFLEESSLGASVMEPGAIAPTDRMAHFCGRGRKWRFLKVYDRRIVKDYRTEANIFVAHFVRQSIRQCRDYSEIAAENPELARECEALRDILARLNAVWAGLMPEFKYVQLKQIPLANPLLQFDPRYHVVLESWNAGF